MLARSIGLAMCVVVLGMTLPAAGEEKFWARHAVDNSSRKGGGADGVRLADVNGDGLPDITTGWEEEGEIRVYLNPGPAKSAQPWPATTVAKVKSPEDAVFVDLDGDGAVDVVSSTEGKNRTIYVHWAPKEKQKYLDASAWTTAPLPATQKLEQWMYALPFDVDGQHGIDLIVGSKNKGSVSWLESPANPRDLASWKLHKIVDAGWIMSLFSRDIDGNGVPDVLVSDRSGPHQGVYWLENLGKGSFKPRPIGGSTTSCKFLDAGDFRGRGKKSTDIVVAAPEGILGFFGEPSETWTPFTIPGRFSKAVAVGDVDLDGRLDIVYTNGEGKKTPEFHGAGWVSFEGDFGTGKPTIHNLSGPEGIKYDRIELIDLDGDGDLDVLTCEEEVGARHEGLGVIWYENPTRQRR